MQVDCPTKPQTDKVVSVHHLNEICLEKKLQKPHSVYITPDSSPARRQHTDDKPAKSVSEHFDPEPTERSLGSHLSSDSDPQTNTNDDSDTSRRMMASNQDCPWDKA